MMTRRRGGAARGKSGNLRAQAGTGGRGRGRGMLSDREGGRGDRGAEVKTGENFAKRSAIVDLDNFYPILRSMMQCGKMVPFLGTRSL